jgi:2',3'-cyclic-nucleotide 2'-phosphodiesterase (5'-nucleotidase family)
MKDHSKRALISLLYVFPMIIAFGIASCNKYYQPTSLQYEQVRITENSARDTALQHMLQPYADSVNKSMSRVIAEVEVPLEKKLPESNLGNLMADAIRKEAERVYNVKIDAAFINYGGIRVLQIPAGSLKLNQVFEMMPFDNLLVVQRIPGNILQLFLDNIAKRGGWPGSGITYVIKNRRATNVLIGGVPFDSTKTYVIANSDYIANGGDDCDMLRTIPQEDKGYLIRDGLIHYFSGYAERGEKINIGLENRVINAD